jgi:mRNA interferase RelE/StbE
LDLRNSLGSLKQMALYRVEFAKGVRKDFKGIPRSDANRILQKIESLTVNPRPPESKKLTNDDSHRIRIGNYRVIYDIQDEVLLVLVVKVGNRKDVYRR